MRLKFLMGAALIAALGVVMVPSSALSVARIDEGVDEAADYDSRVGKIAPTKAQRAHAKRLKASVTWSKFGTPASLSRRGKFLARGVRGKTAPEAARWYLNRHKALFGLSSIDQLELVGANRLAGSNGWSVNLRQVFGGLQAAEGGLVTVGVTGTTRRGWKIGYVSSALTRDRTLVGGVKLSAAGAWVAAARNAGLTRSIANVLSQKVSRGWTQLAVAGVVGTQRSRLVAFPTVRNGVVPAFENIVLDLKQAKPLAARSFVDARTGRILARSNLVDHAANGLRLQAAQTFTFSGSVPATEGACDVKKGPFTVPAGIRALDGFVAATRQDNDLVLNLYFGATKVVADVDTFTSPEVFRYEPAGGVPSGDYFVEACDFPGQGVWLEPRTYEGTLTLDDTPAPIPAWAQWKVFPANPPLNSMPGFPWANSSTDTREVWCWRAADGCDKVVGNLASRGPWDHDHKLNTATRTTKGNNARSATSWTHPFLPFPPQYMPTDANRSYIFPWTNNWFNTSCAPTPGAPGATWDDSAATVNLFVAHNRMHDWSYYLGFTERNWNAQDYNFGLTEPRQESDPIIGDVQSGALVGQRDNANMITLADGVASITNMYFWQPIAGSFYAPCVDGDYDMAVIGHEYTHMIENRMIGKGVGRSGHHAGAMGESIADLNAMEYLNENGFVPTSDENPYVIGAYATGNKHHAIRNYSMAYPMSGGVPMPSQQLSINALNFSDMGYDVTGPTGPCRRRDLECDELPDPHVAEQQVRRRLRLERRRSPGVLCRRTAAGAELPGEPALDPALLRRNAADAGRAVDDRRA